MAEQGSVCPWTKVRSLPLALAKRSRLRKKHLDLDVRALLQELQIESRKAGNELRGHCPDPAHQTRPGSSAATKKGPGTWQIKPKNGYHVCHSCGFGGGPATLVKAVLQLSTWDEAWDWLLDFCGQTLPTGAHSAAWARKGQDPKVQGVVDLPFPPETYAMYRWAVDRMPECVHRAQEFLFARGVTEAEIERHRFGATDVTAPTYKSRVIVPVIVEGRLVDYVARLWLPDPPDLLPKALSARTDKGARKELALWGYDDLDPTLKVVIVVEGVWDALHLLRVGIPNVVAVCGSAWSPERTELLAPWPEVVLMPDGDEAGDKLITRASSLRFTHDVKVAVLPRETQPEDHPPPDIRKCIREAHPPVWSTRSQVGSKAWAGKI